MNKEDYGDTMIYKDTSTGISYIYDGIRGLLPVKFPQEEGGNGGQKRNIGWSDKFDKEELARQDAEREEQIKQEREEAKKNGKIEVDDELEGEILDLGDLWDDQEAMDELIAETENIVRKEKSVRRAEQRAAEKEAQRYTPVKGINDFKQDIKRLIAKEVAPLMKKSWSKMNKKYEGSGVEKPGKLSKKNPKIPRLRIYYDQSTSWDEDDIAIGNRAISELNYYVKKKALIIEVRYFSDDIHSVPVRGATHAGYKLLADINRDKPENVVVMTDSDFDAFGEIRGHDPVVVPGGVFLLFRDGKSSKELIKRLHGKKMTKIYTF